MLNKIKSSASEMVFGKQNNLQKASIIITDTNETIPCQFNPNELSVSRSVHWSHVSLPLLNSPIMQFRGSSPTTCQVNLIFDTSDSGNDVRAYTNQLLRLTLKGGGGHGNRDLLLEPPSVSFVWGKFELFKAVITSLSIAYVLFLPDGTPIRARANITFTQNDHEDDPLPAQNPTSRTDARKTRIVQAGERLDYIAYEEYGEARHWRFLAEANGLDHVEALKPGSLLIIPPLE
ncbi:hypothetical protein FDZ74_13495 [bacterium]|nr:MAG: hypothetical protein FDZ74_13495 [bacterium]